MESLLSGLSQHGYSILFLMVFLESVGLPVPAAIALLIAGGASARGSLNLGFSVATALSAMMFGDTLMFLLGRHTGWWLLGFLCRLSLNPESCILRSADSFHRRGRILLVVAKFVPGINTMAPPLAGSMNMRFAPFIRLDLAGALLYIGAYSLVGFVFSDAIGSMTRGYQAFGRVIGWILTAAVVVYLGVQVWMWIKSRALRRVTFVRPSEAVKTADAVIFDVRSHGYYDRKAMRIQGSRRLEPNAIGQFVGEIPADKQIYLYCTCVREATSVRVARVLLENNIRVAVIKGGLRAWKRAGLPMEAVPSDELAEMPAFD